MLLRRQGFPEEGEFVLCTIGNVHHNSVFANLDEYSKSGLIHISEISPGRIRNIRDFVVEGKKVVCLVLKIDEERGHIDLSLRRVNDNQKRKKISEIKQEQKAEKIVEFIAKKLDIGLTVFYKDIFNKVSKKYPSLASYFEDIALGDGKIDLLELDKDKAKALEELIKERIKPTEVSIISEIELKSFDSNGLDFVKENLKKIATKEIVIKYEGGGRYKLSIKSTDPKKAEEKIKNTTENLIEIFEKSGGEAKLLAKPKK